MREGAKQRLIGATVFVALAVIFVPMLFEPAALDEGGRGRESAPPAPSFDSKGKTEVFLGVGDSREGDPALTPTARVSQPLALPPATESEEPVAEDAPADGSARATGTDQPVAGANQDQAGATPRKGAKAGLPSWVVQVASVPTPEGAAAMEAKLRTAGFSAFVEKAEVNGKTTYRVQVGPESDRTRAEQTATRLRERQKTQALIRSYP